MRNESLNTRITSIRLAVAAAVLGAAVTLAYRPFSQTVRGDCGIYDFIAQSILRGEVPYRDVIDPKAPLSMYLSAMAMAIGRSMGARDVIAVRWLCVLMAGLLSAITYLTAEAYLHSRLAAVIACSIPLVPSSLVLMMTKGTQPKLPMMVFGMLALLLVTHDRPFWAGFCSMLSCLCWQPGLLFAGVVFLTFSRYLTSWRDWRTVKVVAGAAVPLAVLVLYFYSRGALSDLWSWTITYTYSVFRPEGENPIGEALTQIWKIAHREFGSDLVLVGLSLIGFVMYALERVREKLKYGVRSIDLYRDAIVIPPVVYFAFCIIDFQGGPDLLPFLPFFGLFAAWFFIETGRLIASNRLVKRIMPRGGWKSLVPSVAIASILGLILIRATSYRPPSFDLREQARAVSQIADYLGPDDKIYVHGTAEILVLLNRPNLNRYIALDSGADDYIAAQKSGGFKDVIDEIEAAAPKLVAISRLRNVRHSSELEHWVNEHYDELELPGYETIYIRKQE
jgi:hypothetical protein